MPSIYYMNQSAPFWDFIAGLEEQGRNHPFIAAYANGSRDPDSDIPMDENAWGCGHGNIPFRGRNASDAPEAEGTAGGPTAEKGEGDDAPGEEPHARERHHRHRRHRHGHGPSGPGGPGSRCGPWARCGRVRGGWGHGGWGNWAGAGQGYSLASGVPWTLGNIAGFLQTQFENAGVAGMGDEAQGQARGNGDFKPEVDVFDTETSFVVHVSLPGVKKEDLGVNWDSEKSELVVSGVLHRPGDEEFLKTLSMAERQVGPFERKLRLGTLASPAQVDIDAITAKLEDGVLRIDVPKLDKDYVEIKRVDVE